MRLAVSSSPLEDPLQRLGRFSRSPLLSLFKDRHFLKTKKIFDLWWLIINEELMNSVEDEKLKKVIKIV